ncbi:hypothetical protein [Aureispira anguillae]|nr:hypothetical protein [Aureispira anguillae]
MVQTIRKKYTATTRHKSNFRSIEGRSASPSQADVYNRQNAYWYMGYYRRGFVQLIHQPNYAKISQLLGVDFYAARRVINSLE